jgi:hypothetical protein
MYAACSCRQHAHLQREALSGCLVDCWISAGLQEGGDDQILLLLAHLPHATPHVILQRVTAFRALRFQGPLISLPPHGGRFAVASSGGDTPQRVRESQAENRMPRRQGTLHDPCSRALSIVNVVALFLLACRGGLTTTPTDAESGGSGHLASCFPMSCSGKP